MLARQELVRIVITVPVIMWAQLGIKKVMLLLMYGRFSRRMAQSAHVYSASKLASHLISTN